MVLRFSNNRKHDKRRDIGGLSWTSLAEAREKARHLRKTARDGGDPLADLRKERGMPTFAEAARKVHEMNRPGWRKGGVHIKHWIVCFENHVFPKIATSPSTRSGAAMFWPCWRLSGIAAPGRHAASGR